MSSDLSREEQDLAFLEQSTVLLFKTGSSSLTAIALPLTHVDHVIHGVILATGVLEMRRFPSVPSLLRIFIITEYKLY